MIHLGHLILRTADFQCIIFQLNGILNVAVCHAALEHRLYGNLLDAQKIHLHVHLIGAASFNGDVVVADDFRNLVLLDLAVIGSDGDVAVAELQKILALAIDLEIHRSIPALGQGQIPVGKQAVFIGKGHGNIPNPLAVFRGDGGDHIHPQAQGNDDCQQQRYNFISFHGCHLPDSFWIF